MGGDASRTKFSKHEKRLEQTVLELELIKRKKKTIYDDSAKLLDPSQNIQDEVHNDLLKTSQAEHADPLPNEQQSRSLADTNQNDFQYDEVAKNIHDAQSEILQKSHMFGDPPRFASMDDYRKFQNMNKQANLNLVSKMVADKQRLLESKGQKTSINDSGLSELVQDEGKERPWIEVIETTDPHPKTTTETSPPSLSLHKRAAKVTTKAPLAKSTKSASHASTSSTRELLSNETTAKPTPDPFTAFVGGPCHALLYTCNTYPKDTRVMEKCTSVVLNDPNPKKKPRPKVDLAKVRRLNRLKALINERYGKERISTYPPNMDDVRRILAMSATQQTKTTSDDEDILKDIEQEEATTAFDQFSNNDDNQQGDEEAPTTQPAEPKADEKDILSFVADIPEVTTVKTEDGEDALEKKTEDGEDALEKKTEDGEDAPEKKTEDGEDALEKKTEDGEDALEKKTEDGKEVQVTEPSTETSNTTIKEDKAELKEKPNEGSPTGGKHKTIEILQAKNRNRKIKRHRNRKRLVRSILNICNLSIHCLIITGY
ncbi:uncharacterized protein LOC113388552 [Ctenocephalides felis]|uniref:uncharacterized protein LOC113388552 n=1 Tax=Ctenocephalides felis TaxID=7515 RepID=UPI000E6E2BDE|nr:uncharacterized protein LOC113388552 [Ctenocephalides felis]